MSYSRLDSLKLKVSVRNPMYQSYCGLRSLGMFTWGQTSLLLKFNYHGIRQLLLYIEHLS